MKEKSKLSVAMLGHKRIPSREGGVEIVVEKLSSGLVREGHAVTCYNRKGHHVGGSQFDAEELDSYNGITIKTVPTLDKKGLAAMTASATAAIACAFKKYDVVHFHAEGPCAMLWLPKLFGKRCIATIHGLDHQRSKWGKLAKTYIMMGEKCAARYAHEVIVLSKNVQDYFMDTYGRKTHFIPNGVDRAQKRTPEQIKEKFQLQGEDYILYLGRIVPEKGLTYLVNAFKQVKTDKKLIIAGGASDTAEFFNELKALAADDPRIQFVGFVQGQLLEELYSNAYMYVLPSDLEGMPLSLLEAMSYGNCCLTSDIAECTQVTEDHGISFRKSDVEDLRKKLQILCDDSQMVQTYKEQAADYICEKYSWEQVTRQTLNLYYGENP